jgi:hypothetical protein
MLGVWSGGAASFASAAGNVLDLIHAQSPNTKILVIGSHTCTNLLGTNEPTIAPYRSALLGIVPSRSSWCSALNLSSITVAMDDTDSTHLHPNAAGQSAILSAVRSAISLL